MGEHNVKARADEQELRNFSQSLLLDLRAFEKILEDGLIERDVRRVGAEQEMFLVDQNWKPAPIAVEVLEAMDDDQFTTELGRFNLECNLAPEVFQGKCLSSMERQLKTKMDHVREAASRCGGRVVLTGILPTLHKSDLDLSNMTPNPRYYAINEALTRLRGGHYEFRIQGIDELNLMHESVMLEACNTSFQVHFQVGFDEFAALYNIAQTVAAPVMAVACNSPLLFGRRLWQETRIALFEQSIDTRQTSSHLRHQTPRVSFGRDWVRRSPVEIFREDISRFRSILCTEIDEDPFEVLSRGGAPQLQALRLHNSTIYRWNRVCYGVSDDKPHLRIENRILPSGPTVTDEIANAAFWFGLMSGLVENHRDVTQVFDFDDVKANFFAAAQAGLNAQLTWIDKHPRPARDLLLEELLPLAESGLRASRIDETDIDTYLGIIRQRLEHRQTGSYWLLTSLGGMQQLGTPAERMSALTAATYTRQEQHIPVHQWEPAELVEAGGWKQNYLRIEHYMSPDLVTAREHDSIELVANLMDWNNIRHLLVEDDQNRLVGLVSSRALVRLMGSVLAKGESAPVSVADVMERNPVTVSPETSTLDAIELMRERKLSCLPVVKDGQLVGVITDSDFMGMAGKLLEHSLRDQESSAERVRE